jgi:ABC-2 type transport system permease protein
VSRIGAVLRKDMRLIWREPGFVAVQLVGPLLLLVGFGTVFSITPSSIQVAVRDGDGSRAARDLGREVASSDVFHVVDADRPGATLDDGASLAALEIPAGYARRRARGEPGGARLLVDASDGGARAVERVLVSLVTPAPARPEVTTAIWYNPTLDDAVLFVPGVVAMLLFAVPAIFTSLSIVREKEAGTWTLLGATPVGDVELLAAKLIPHVVQAVVTAVGTLLLAVLVFRVPVRGSLPALAVGTGLLLLASIGFGGVFSVLADTQDAAWRLLSLFVLLPGFMLSGFLVPLSSMPDVAQALSRAFPARPYLELLRGVLVRGGDLALVGSELAILAAFAGGAMLLALALLWRSRQAVR